MATVLAALIALSSASAGAVAACPEPVAYPGDAASKKAIARWMAEGVVRAGLPAELPVMGALVESGLANLSGGHADTAGYFQMRVSVWNKGAYEGFPDHPELQLQWFIDYATKVRQDRIAAGGPDPAADEWRWGDWIADVLRPAAQYRGRYQLRLAEARELIGTLCSEPAPGAVPQDAAPGGVPQHAAPNDTPQAPGPALSLPPVSPIAQADPVAPAVRLGGARAQRVLRRGAILVTFRCPHEACTASATATVALPRHRALRLASTLRRGEAGHTLTLRLKLVREARAILRRALRSGRSPRALVRVLARDEAGNRTLVKRTIRLTG